jgi:hypothetical protein
MWIQVRIPALWRVVEGNRKGTWCLGLSLGDINTGWGLDAMLTILLHKKYCLEIEISENV